MKRNITCPSVLECAQSGYRHIVGTGYEKFWLAMDILVLVVGLIRVSSDARQGGLLIAFGLVFGVVNSIMIYRDGSGRNAGD
jgi:hypothetical protein